MKRILLVEDNELNRDMLSRRLRKVGYEVITVADGSEALQTAGAECPDLILMDISLPKMDGLTVTRRLRDDKKTAQIPIIALTAHAIIGDREKSLEAGCDEYETKPVDMVKLLSKIAQFIG